MKHSVGNGLKKLHQYVSFLHLHSIILSILPCNKVCANPAAEFMYTKGSGMDAAGLVLVLFFFLLLSLSFILLARITSRVWYVPQGVSAQVASRITLYGNCSDRWLNLMFIVWMTLDDSVWILASLFFCILTLAFFFVLLFCFYLKSKDRVNFWSNCNYLNRVTLLM